MDHRPLGSTGLSVSRIGWGTVKIGRNTGVKYPAPFEQPSAEEATAIIHGMLDLGVTLVDTAPAYGCAESILGSALGSRRNDVVLCTKVGECFTDGTSHHDFTGASARASLTRSLKALRTPHVDLLLIHSDGADVEIQRETDLVETLQALRDEGLTRAIGLSGKTVEGAHAALDWADVLMCSLSVTDREHEAVIQEAAARGVGVLLKKVLGSGHLPAGDALEYVLHESPAASSVACAVIGSLSPDRMASNIARLQR